MDYVKVWTETTDSGGLTFVSLDTFQCFKAIEMVTYDLIKRGLTKEEVTSQTFQVFLSENIQFHCMDADL